MRELLRISTPRYTQQPMKDQLRAKIHNHTAVVAVIGLGYVGLPLRHGSGQALAVAFAEKGFPVTFVATQCRPFDTAQDRLWHRCGRPQGGRAEARRVGWAGSAVGPVGRGQAAGRAVAGNDTSRW